jgi:hypothetical protein
MTAINTRMPVGFPGAVTRDEPKRIQQAIIDPANPPTAFGSFVKLVGGKIQPLASGDAATVIYGSYVRSFPIQGNSLTGTNTPPTSGIGDVLRGGFMAVLLAKGAAAKEGQVYVVTTAGGTVAVGDIVTSASPAGGGTAVAVPGCFFEGPSDAGGITEISVEVAGLLA